MKNMYRLVITFWIWVIQDGNGRRAIIARQHVDCDESTDFQDIERIVQTNLSKFRQDNPEINHSSVYADWSVKGFQNT